MVDIITRHEAFVMSRSQCPPGPLESSIHLLRAGPHLHACGDDDIGTGALSIIEDTVPSSRYVNQSGCISLITFGRCSSHSKFVIRFVFHSEL